MNRPTERLVEARSVVKPEVEGGGSTYEEVCAFRRIKETSERQLLFVVTLGDLLLFLLSTLFTGTVRVFQW